jgi:hypothetical protein
MPEHAKRLERFLVNAFVHERVNVLVCNAAQVWVVQGLAHV